MSPTKQNNPENKQKAKSPRHQQPRKPSGFLYALLCLYTRTVFTLMYGLRIDKKAIKGIKKPVLVISNHQSNYDFLVVAAALWPLRLNAMTASWFFHNKTLRWVLNRLGAISKKQFVPDTSAIKSAMKVAARGDNVAVFPEGQVCYSGMNCDVDESVGKLIKKLEVTTINLKIRGNHLTWPKWSLSKGTYRGRVQCTVEVLFTPEQIQKMSLDEVTAKAIHALNYNEYEWQRSQMVQYRPALRKTKGLNIVLHRCPACGTEYATQTENNELFCEHCGYRVAMNRYGFFELVNGQELLFDNPAAWYSWQKEAMVQDAKAQKVLPVVCPSTLYKTVEGKHGYTKCGRGTMTLDDTGLHFEGTKDGQPFSKSVLYDQQSTLAHSAAECAIDIQGEGESYGFAPDEKRHMLYVVDMYSIIRKLKKEQE